MNAENLKRADDSLAKLMQNLLDAHTDAADSGNQFAEIVCLGLVAQARALQQPIEQALIAAGGEP